ncbi:hypothetical protein FACS189454_01510 [Planctomycetales bacterium]|nr:hypothetical protein FACS189454_01510 [Planctomycetales bacterium]
MTANDLLMLLGVKSLILFAAALIVGTLLFVMKVRTPLIHRIVWFGVLLLGIAGAGVPVTVFVEAQIAETKVSEAAAGVEWSAARVENESESVLSIPSARNPPPAAHNLTRTALPAVPNLLIAVWFIIFVLLMLRRTVLYFVLLHQLQSAVPVNDELYLTLLKNHKIRPGKLPLLLATGIGPALVCRWTDSVIVIPPELWEEADDSVRRGIIEHEIAHYVQKDILVCGLARLIAAVHWFNPAAWFAVRKFEEATEWACDAAAFGNQESGEHCLSKSLLMMHETMPSIVLNRFSFGGGKLSRRVSFLHSVLIQPKESVMKKFFVFGILVLVLAAGTVSVRIAAQEKVQKHNEPPMGSSQGITTPQAWQSAKADAPPMMVPVASSAESKPAEWDKTLWQRVPAKQEGMSPWTSYIIEPPDILHIQSIHLVPKSPYRLRVFDVVAIDVTGTHPDPPINGAFSVEPGGKIQLGNSYGSMNVEGLAVEQLEQVVVEHLKDKIENLSVSVKLMRMTDMQQIEGNHLVAPDGFITLGSYGRVNVTGLTVPECQNVIERRLAHFLDKPQVSVEVAHMNSKVYYVIIKSANGGDRVMKFPCTGNDTVMAAITELNGMMPDVNDNIQHIRPGKGDDDTKTTQLQWSKIILHRAGYGQNMQLLPEDRIIFEVKPTQETQRIKGDSPAMPPIQEVMPPQKK